jgi:GT2 family glycosyltransferase
LLQVVIPATDSPATLGRCLAALARSSEPHAVEVVAAPRGSGPAAARNAGVARTSGEIVVFVDADVEVHPDALRRLREAFAREPGVDAVFGGYDDRPAAPSVVSRFRNLLHHHVHARAGGPATTFWAGLGAIRREAFHAVGGFDAERYPTPCIEDIELGMRLHAAGRRIVLDPAVRGTHLKRWTLASMLRTDLASRGAPWVALRLERGGAGGGALNLAWAQRLAALAALVATAAALSGRGRLALLATAAMVAPNARFYALLARLGGPGLALGGVPLHLVHHLSAAASIPAGVVLWARRARA